MSRSDSQVTGTGEKSVAELEAEIARTRAQLGRHVEDISYKLSPDRFKEQAQGTLQSAQEAVMESVNEMTENVLGKTKEAGSSFADMIRRHPLPTALIGVGVALLAAGGGVGMKRAHDDDDGLYGSYGEGSVGSSGTQSYGAARGFESYGAYDSGYDTGAYTAGGTSYPAGSEYGSSYGGAGGRGGAWSESDTQGLGDRAGEAGQQAKRRAKAASRGLGGFIEEQPLIAGLVTVMLGAIIGLSLPGTRREDELLGSTRDHLAEQAREVAERAKGVAQKTFDEAKETAKQEFGKVQGEAKDAAKNVAEDAKKTAENETDKQRPS